MTEIVSSISGGRLLGRWKGRVKEYMCERGANRRGGFELARRECYHRKRLSTFS